MIIIIIIIIIATIFLPLSKVYIKIYDHSLDIRLCYWIKKYFLFSILYKNVESIIKWTNANHKKIHIKNEKNNTLKEELLGALDELDNYSENNSNNARAKNIGEYESKGDKNKNVSPEEYLDMIKPYLRNMINDHKVPMKLKVHSRDEVIDYETQFGE